MRAERAAAFVAALLLAQGAWADPVAQAEQALKNKDVAGALRILEEATSSGHVGAKGKLANQLRYLPPPQGDIERGCTLAKEASDAGDALGAITRADCVLIGREKADQPHQVARGLARRALRSGLPFAGLTLYVAYSMDPKYGYLKDGKPDLAKYNMLAAMPLAERGEQIEAFDGLAEAMRAGQIVALTLGLAYLLDSSAPGNVERALRLEALLQASGVKIPERYRGAVQTAQQLRRLGTTHASPLLFGNAYPAVLAGAAAQIRGPGGASPCELKDIRPVALEAEPVEHAQYLPLTKAPLTETYLLRGSWSEVWTFAGCGKSAAVPVNFVADGWSGARFTIKYR